MNESPDIHENAGGAFAPADPEFVADFSVAPGTKEQRPRPNETKGIPESDEERVDRSASRSSR